MKRTLQMRKLAEIPVAPAGHRNLDHRVHRRRQPFALTTVGTHVAPMSFGPLGSSHRPVYFFFHSATTAQPQPQFVKRKELITCAIDTFPFHFASDNLILTIELLNLGFKTSFRGSNPIET